MADNQNDSKIEIHMDKDLATLYSSYCAIHDTNEEVYFNFSAGLIPSDNNLTMPIHSRIAMNYYSAKRMFNLLSQIIAKHEQEYGEIIEDSNKRRIAQNNKASFPKMDD